MNIAFDKDIILFENKSDFQIIKDYPFYKKYYKPIFLELINELHFDSQYIDSIHILHNKSSYGTTRPQIENNHVSFTIELSDDILLYISNVQDSLDTFKAKAIFQHEVCHCIEIKKLLENKCLNSPNPLDDNFLINTTYNFLYSESVNVWSEFFACYHNRKINEWHEIPDVEKDLIQLNKWINATQHCLIGENDIRLCEDMLTFLHEFWYHMVSIIAIHLHNHEDILINGYQNAEYDYIPKYFEYIYQFFQIKLEYYPIWLSEDNYINLGKALMKILELNNITFSTNDLSDNFIFKSIK